jgi:hypothetical protein
MSDLADALFQTKLMGQALDGASIDLGSVQQAALEADLLSTMGDAEISDTEASILNAKAASNYVNGGDFDVDAGDLLQAEIEADLIDGFI